MKKKLLAVATAFIAAALALCMAGCGKEAPVNLPGSWQLNDSVAMTTESQALITKALKGLTGANYTPVAYLATQTVAGTSHLFVCRGSLVVPNSEETWALVTVYEDLKGGVTIGNITRSNIPTHVNGLADGWSAPDSPDITKDLRKAIKKAAKEYGGVEIAPVAVLAKQVVAGTNYTVLARVTPTANGASTSWALVTLYVDLKGDAEITNVTDFVSA